METETKPKEKTSKKSSVIYLGHIPTAFEEPQMRKFFEQFGEVKRLRLSRNKKTGASKHYAFIEFETPQIAEIVMNTMNNYILFGHKLKCDVMSVSDIHEDLWKGANRRYFVRRNKKLPEKNPLTAQKVLSILKHRQAFNKSIKEKLEKLGISYDYLDKMINEDNEVMDVLKSSVKAADVVEEKESEEESEEKSEEKEEEEEEEKSEEEEEKSEKVVEKSQPVVKRLSKKAKKASK